MDEPCSLQGCVSTRLQHPSALHLLPAALICCCGFERRFLICRLALLSAAAAAAAAGKHVLHQMLLATYLLWVVRCRLHARRLPLTAWCLCLCNVR